MMNVTGLLGNFATTPGAEVGAVSPSHVAVSSLPSAITEGAANVSISTAGQFYSDMQQLSQQNPDEFQTVAAQVAASFQNAASQTTGSQAQFLTTLANQFNQAAQTGSLDPTQSASSAEAAQAVHGVQAASPNPSGGSTGAHHHHHRHGGSDALTAPSGAVQQAFESAMGVLSQSVQGASTATSSGSATST
ncbi:MAG: hypothetical protein ABSC94_28210 [Polyangiaceae bacterium]|jgi:hypothetical protein